MDPIMDDAAPVALAFSPQERLERLGVLTAGQRAFALTYLAGYAPAVFDAVIDAVATCDDDLGAYLAAAR